MVKKNKTQDTTKPCLVCGKNLGSVSAAISSHMRKHVRDGSISESKNKLGKLEWKTTGKEPRNKEFDFRPTPARIKSNIPPRIMRYAKADKDGNISLKCPTCEKYKSVMQTKSVVTKENDQGRKSLKEITVAESFVDDRFVYSRCCDKAIIFPKRRLEAAIANPGKETRD
jgi:DNA-directed RNA polymerase subunit M/transcription elongation factor TFIIS